ncbi:MAG: hypothetical protein ACXWZL_06515 [Mycobacterium sp.]
MTTRIPYSRVALAAAEAVRINEPEYHPAFAAVLSSATSYNADNIIHTTPTTLFAAYFSRGEDIEDWTVIAECAESVGVEPFAFRLAHRD